LAFREIDDRACAGGACRPRRRFLAALNSSSDSTTRSSSASAHEMTTAPKEPYAADGGAHKRGHEGLPCPREDPMRAPLKGGRRIAFLRSHYYAAGLETVTDSAIASHRPTDRRSACSATREPRCRRVRPAGAIFFLLGSLQVDTIW